MVKAKEFGLAPNIVEKDYVLSWVLAGISLHELFSDTWIFKGGTCLKKCYFEHYRFSEDLDYTLIDSVHLSKQYLELEFKKIIKWIYDHSGIKIPLISFEEYLNLQGKLSIEGKLEYQGPMQRRSNSPKIKLDLTCDELLVFPPERRIVYHSYSDIGVGALQVSTYCVEEIFSEKIRALAQRLRPRDLYDVINLYVDTRWAPDKNKVFDALKKKCEYKGIDLPTMDVLNALPAKQELINGWEEMLAYQLSNLAPYDNYWEKLPAVFEWIYG